MGACALFPSAVLGQINVSGVTDKATYNNTATLTIGTPAGFDYDATLNWKPVATGTPVVLNKPDFYELRVNATNQTNSAVTSQYLRFIIKAGERVDTEWGLPPHVPFPVIQSSPAEFADAHLRLITPASFPAGYAVPLVAWAVDDQDHAVRANGFLKNAGANLFQVKRGVGSGFITPPVDASTLNLSLELGGVLSTNLNIALETNVAWTTVSGTLSGAVTWTNDARIQITGGTIIPAGSSLTVGAGTIVRVNSGVDITNNGIITINGTLAQPVVFMPTTSGQPWGGFVQHANNASFIATGTIFTGSGAQPCWFAGHECGSSISGISSHRGPQALISLVGSNCNLSMTDSAAIYLAGQWSHSVVGAANSYNIHLTRFLMQRAVSGGEFTKASFTVNDSAFIECPDDSVNFEDEDNDALYLVSGSHNFTNTLFGWTKDDGIDSGGTDSATMGFARLNYQSCWFEATFHEGNSLSGFKNVFTRDTVYFDCGQGIEDGYNAPTGRVEHCFFSMNQSGIRHGDNYPTIGSYDGRLTATNNISIYNHRDLFGFNWNNTGGWTNSYDRFFASNNFVSVLDTNYPNNTLWNPAADGWRLASLGGVGRVGVGFGVRGTTLGQFSDGLPVGLSRFCTNEVRVDYAMDGTDGTHLTGTLIFPAGLTRQYIPVPLSITGVLRVALSSPLNADVTSGATLFFQNLPPESTAPIVLSPAGASWKYLDNGSEQGTAWRAASFDDSAWSSGAGRLGFGADPAPLGATLRKFVQTNGVDTARQITNFYFRREVVITNPADFATIRFRYQRDDGCIVYLNSNELFRSNMPGGAVTANTFASTTISGVPALMTYWTNTFAATNLLAGTNVIAVEVHQSTSTSSDIAWEMELRGLPESGAARVNLTKLGGGAVLYWSDPAFALEEADGVTGPWRLSSTNSPAGSALTGDRFFRLKK